MPITDPPSPPRLNAMQAAPDGVKALIGLQRYVNDCGLDHRLQELIKLRCSQINGCAYCVDMHANDARTAGETDRRLDQVAVWRESPLFTPAERAALAWAEAVTLVSASHVPYALVAEVTPFYSGKALADLTFAVIVINAWNRLAVAFRPPLPAEGRASAGA